MQVLSFFKSATFAHDKLHQYFENNDVSDGFSIHPKDGSIPKDGYMVAHDGPKLSMDRKDFEHGPTRRDSVTSFLDKHKDYFHKNPEAHLGGWHNESSGKYEIEPSHHIKDKNEAIQRGKKHNQIAIFDVKNGREINTGGTGVYDHEK